MRGSSLRVIGSNKLFDNFKKENGVRLIVYEFLKEGFSYPSSSVYDKIIQTPIKKITDNDKLRNLLARVPKKEDLQTLYTTYFDVVYKEKGCHLREGEYLKNKASISKLLLECKGFYKNFGLYLPYNELPDSLDIELEFMYYLTYLIYKECEENSNYSSEFLDKIVGILKAQRDFLKRHLFSFMKELNECLSKYNELHFYFTLSDISIDFFKDDLEFIDEYLLKFGFKSNE